MIIQAEDLAGMGSSYVNSQDAEYKQKHSHQKVILTDEQWESVTKIFHQLGKETKYHGYVMLYCNHILVYVHVRCITYIDYYIILTRLKPNQTIVSSSSSSFLSVFYFTV
jgi:hypothetical protein